MKDKVISIFKPSDNAATNLENFIRVQKESIFRLLFEGSIDWESNTWDIKGFESTTSSGKANQAKKILFTQSNGIQSTKTKVANDLLVPFEKPFLSFVKAHVTYRHNAKRKTKDNHMLSVRAYRYLYEQLSPGSKDIGNLTVGHFDRAAKAALIREKNTSAYRVGVALAEIADLLRTHKLTPMAIRWKNSIPRDAGPSGRAARNSKEAESHRAKMMPKTDVLIYLAALWSRYEELEEQDKSLLCVAIILLFAGFRIDEALSLDEDCLSTDYEFNPITGIYHKVMKIRVLAKKSAKWTTKKIPESAQDTIQLAIERLKSLSEGHRAAARLLLQDGKYHKLNNLDGRLLMTAKELTELLGVSSVSNFNSIMKGHKVKPASSMGPLNKGGAALYRIGDINAAIHDEFVRAYPDIVKGFGNDSFRLPLWNLISLRFVDEFTPKGAPQWYPLPISQNVTQDFFKGRNYLRKH